VLADGGDGLQSDATNGCWVGAGGGRQHGGAGSHGWLAGQIWARQAWIWWLLKGPLGLSPVGCSVVCLLCCPADAASVRVCVCASSLGCCAFNPLGMWLWGTGEILAGWFGTDAAAPEGVFIPPWRASRFPPSTLLGVPGETLGSTR
jgi:hypothetical protein